MKKRSLILKDRPINIFKEEGYNKYGPPKSVFMMKNMYNYFDILFMLYI